MPATDVDAQEQERVAAEYAAAEAQRTTDEANEDAQFDAGFKGDTTPEDDRVPTTPPQEGTPVETTPIEEAVIVPPIASVPALTKEQVDQILSVITLVPELKSTMEKQFGSAFGRIGGITQTLKAFQDSSVSSGEPIKVSKDDLKELLSDFPDLSERLVPVLNRVFERVKIPKGGSAQIFDPSEIAKIADQRFEEHTPALRRKIAAEDLSELHPSWRDIVGAPGGSTTGQTTLWGVWLDTQPVDYQVKVKNSWNATIVGNSIDRFHADVEKANLALAKPKGKLPVEDSRKQRLAEAVNKKSTVAQETVKSDDDMFNEGFYGPSKK